VVYEEYEGTPAPITFDRVGAGVDTSAFSRDMQASQRRHDAQTSGDAYEGGIQAPGAFNNRGQNGIARAPNFGQTPGIIVPPRVGNNFLGINTRVSPPRLAPTQSPFCQNMDSIDTPGSLRSRKGFAKGSVHASNTDGVQTLDLLFDDSNGDPVALMVSNTGSNPAFEVSALTVPVPQSLPLQSAPKPLGLAGTAGTIGVSINALTTKYAVQNVRMGYSTGNYPLTPVADSDREGIAFTDFPWYGDVNLSVTLGGLTAGTYFVALWLEGVAERSPPFLGKVVVS